jgi:hypothetical protein
MIQRVGKPLHENMNSNDKTNRFGGRREDLILSNEKEMQIMKIPLGRRNEGWPPTSLNGRFICSNLRLSLLGWSELGNTFACEMIKW